MGVIHSFGGGGGDGRSGPISARRARVLLWIGDRVARRVERYGLLRVRRQFEEQAVVPEDALLFTTAACQNLGKREDIRIGARFVCRGTLRREAFGGTIEIGDDVYIGDYSVISCGERVVLEDGVTVAYNVNIFDNDAHPLDPEARSAHLADIMSVGHSPAADVPVAPVVVERGAWIGTGAVVLKGVRIGAAAVVGAGSVVTRDVPPGAIVAGNPARVVEGPSSDAR